MHVCVRKRITSYAMSGIEGGKQGSPWQAPLSPSLLALHITHRHSCKVRVTATHHVAGLQTEAEAETHANY